MRTACSIRVKLLILKIYWILTAFYLRFRGAKVGKGVKCSGFPYVKIKKGGRFIIEDGVCITSANFANPLNIGRRMGFFVAQNAELILKKECGLSSSRLIANIKISIEEKAFIGADCLICDSDMHEVPLWSGKETKMAPINVKKGAFVGANCILLKGVTIGEGAVIGAGSVIVSDVVEHTVEISSKQYSVKRTL